MINMTFRQKASAEELAKIERTEFFKTGERGDVDKQSEKWYSKREGEDEREKRGSRWRKEQHQQL